jgi:hypothetical protein
MKFISLILIFLLMQWTWGLATSSRTLSQDVHLGIQEDLKGLITDYIQENLPNSKNLKFERFWTERVKDSQIRASFVYSFEDETAGGEEARVGIEGEALLNRKADGPDATQVWSLDEITVLNNRVEFKDGIKISPKGVIDEESEEAPAAGDAGAPATEEQ